MMKENSFFTLIQKNKSSSFYHFSVFSSKNDKHFLYRLRLNKEKTKIISSCISEELLFKDSKEYHYNSIFVVYPYEFLQVVSSVFNDDGICEKEVKNIFYYDKNDNSLKHVFELSVDNEKELLEDIRKKNILKIKDLAENEILLEIKKFKEDYGVCYSSIKNSIRKNIYSKYDLI